MKVLNSVNKLEKGLNLILQTRIEMEMERTELSNQLRLCDLEMTDLVHYLELHDISDNKALKIAKEIKDLQRKRRIIKDQLSLIRDVSNMLDAREEEFIRMEDLRKKLDKKLNGNNERFYTPRIRKDLFESEDN